MAVAVTRSNQRELTRQKNEKKLGGSVKEKRRDDRLSAVAHEQRDSEIMRQKQKKATEEDTPDLRLCGQPPAVLRGPSTDGISFVLSLRWSLLCFLPFRWPLSRWAITGSERYPFQVIFMEMSNHYAIHPFFIPEY